MLAATIRATRAVLAVRTLCSPGNSQQVVVTSCVEKNRLAVSVKKGRGQRWTTLRLRFLCPEGHRIALHSRSCYLHPRPGRYSHQMPGSSRDRGDHRFSLFEQFGFDE